MEAGPTPRWWSLSVALGWISVGLGGIQIYVGGAPWTAIMPGFVLLALFALPEWLHQLKMARRRSRDS